MRPGVLAIRTQGDKTPLRGVRTKLLPLLVCVLAVLPPIKEGSAALNRSTAKPAPRQAPLVAPSNLQVETTKVRHEIEAGENLSAILALYSVPKDEIQQWCDAARPKANLRNLVVGRDLTLGFDGSLLTSLRYAVDEEHELVIERDGWLGFDARLKELPVAVKTVGARGIVRSSFYEASKRAGVPDSVISEMVDLLAWKIDFNSDVHPGDQFRVLYEQRTDAEGRLLTPGHVLAADFAGRTHSASAFRYEDDRGEAVYLDANGEPVERAFLRYPLEFTRITSSFSYSRFHPILKRRRPHMGVDFAAPSGTPVRAIGAGKISFAGWKSGYGRHIEIDHGEGFSSVYSHLRAFRPGVRPGMAVKQAQIIGSVGQTGLATGPHLHFGMFKDGRYLDPLKMKQPARVVHVDAARFAAVHAELRRELRSIPGGYRTASSMPAIALSSVAQARQLGPVVLTM